ncbi:hypothetical protein LTR37_011026 [Vermiconidia calcicola]|uniref:Uncharacterized protein n=1 Tax=Vermiconidia calcicola TaxID=1690605 RepID=A0ACC3N3I6_9PEZI|nr:hypothetical protein LTR37_011026 [Vermiconidia calcicola]
MRSSILSALSLLALDAVAAPAPAPASAPTTVDLDAALAYISAHPGMLSELLPSLTAALPYPYGSCMTRADAERVAKNFEVLQDETFNQTLAEEAVSPEFIDYNDSINTLINQGCPIGPKPLGSPTFASRAEYFAAAQNQQPTPYDTLNLWYNCDTVTVRWRARKPYGKKFAVEGGLVTGVKPQVDVVGIVVIETRPNPDTTSEEHFQFTAIYSEFNSFAWGYDLGLWESELCNAQGEAPPPPPAANDAPPKKRSLVGSAYGVQKL